MLLQVFVITMAFYGHAYLTFTALAFQVSPPPFI
jgi:hypothetical protein